VLLKKSKFQARIPKFLFFFYGLAFQIKMSYIVIEEKKNEKN
jgi:hypothetical protein